MSQDTVFGAADMDAFLRVDRATGGTEFYRVIDGESVLITETEYEKGTRDGGRTEVD